MLTFNKNVEVTTLSLFSPDFVCMCVHVCFLEFNMHVGFYTSCQIYSVWFYKNVHLLLKKMSQYLQGKGTLCSSNEHTLYLLEECA
jgi:hypothetical protein